VHVALIGEPPRSCNSRQGPCTPIVPCTLVVTPPIVVRLTGMCLEAPKSDTFDVRISSTSLLVDLMSLWIMGTDAAEWEIRHGFGSLRGDPQPVAPWQ
jgi:hypothetical protein